MDLIEDWLHEEWDSQIDLNLFNLGKELYIKLNEYKRTGILRAIMLQNDYYRFSYHGNGEKHGRHYLCRHIVLWEVNHAFLITLDPGIMDEEDAFGELNNIQHSFIDGLQKTFSLVYNKSTREEEGDSDEKAYP